MLIAIGAILNLFGEMAMKEPFIYFVALAIITGIISMLTKISRIGGKL